MTFCNYITEWLVFTEKSQKNSGILANLKDATVNCEISKSKYILSILFILALSDHLTKMNDLLLHNTS